MPEERDLEGGESEEGTRMNVGIYTLPTDIITALKEEMNRVTGSVGNRVFYQAGFEGGRALVKRQKLSSRLDIIATDINDLTMASGIGLVDVEVDDFGDVIVTSSDSAEAKATPKTGRAGCHLTCGFLAGVVSGLMGISYKGKEEACVNKGDAVCRFRLSRIV